MAGKEEFQRILEGAWAPVGALLRPATRPDGVSELDYWRMYICSTDLGGTQPTLDELIRQLTKIGLRSLMRTLSDLNQLLRNDGTATEELQQLFCRRFLRPEQQARLGTLRNSNQRVLFFPQQIMVLMKLALLHAPDRMDTRSGEAWRNVVVDLLLQVSDLLPSPVSSPNDRPSEEEMLRFHIQTFVFNHAEQYRYLIPRAWLLYVETPGELSLCADSDFVDVRTLFRRATGLELREYIAFGYALLAGFVNRSLVRHRYKEKQIAINPKTYFRLSRIGIKGKKLLDSLSSDNSRTLAAIRARPAESPRFTTDFLPFMARPLYQIQEDMTVPIHLPFLEAKLTSGIYWILADNLDGNGRERFMRFFGKLFEHYVRCLIQRAIPDSPGLARRVFPEFPYSTSGGERRTCDIAILYGNVALFLEVTAGRLRLENTLLAADMIAFDQDLDKIVLKKARQLHRCIQDFREGLFNFDGQTVTDIPRIYPIIITPESLPEGKVFWDHLRALLASQHLFDQRGINPLHLLDIEELEMLEPVISTGHSLLAILQRREEQYARDMSFKNHLLAEYKPGVNAFLSAKNEEIGAYVRNLLFES